MQACDLEFIGPRKRILHETVQGLAYLHCSGPDPGCKSLLHLDVKRYLYQHNNYYSYGI